MAKLPPDEVQKIIERDLPGYTLAEPAEAADERTTRAEPEESAPDIDELREKYLGENEPAENPGGESAGTPDAAGGGGGGGTEAEGEQPEDMIVSVRRKDATDPWDHDARPKTVVISDGKIVGSQG
jgi:hypothetical protein